MNLFLFKSYIKYRLKARYKKGYGLHSPFVFNLVRELFYCEHSFNAFDKINAYRKKLLVSKKTINVTDLGSGSRVFKSNVRNVSDIVRYTSTEKKYGELLFRMVNEFKPRNIVELGTSVGLGTCYLAMPNSRCEVYTIEGCKETADVAKETFSHLKCSGVKQLVGEFDEVLPTVINQLEQIDFVYFDGNHQKQPTLDYFQMCLGKVNNNSVFVFDDIHWSEGMEEAWEVICAHPDVTVSLDLFNVGIVFFRKECQKQHFIVKY